MKLKAVDLFCGCGGISCGMQLAGFDVIAGIDIEPKYLVTFSHNFPNAKSLDLDISKISPEEFMDKIGVVPGELDLLAGGPPCQGFSKNVPRKHRYIDDPNNKLIKAFLDYCESIKPKMVLMENVAEMKNGFNQAYTEEILERLTEEGYTVTYEVLNAADYGVPQRRRRAFFVANRFGVKFKLPPRTHVERKNQLSLIGLPQHITVWEAIGDLPSLKIGEGEEYMPYAKAPFTEYQKIMRGDLTRVRNHQAKLLKPLQYERLAALQPGQGLKDLPKHLQTKGGYSGAYGRLTKDMIAPTITRWVFHPGSGRWGHPVDIRLITIREAARLQSFPDWFEFEGSYTQQAGQLGNAVPPLLAARIVESMLDQLEEVYDSRSSKKDSNESFSSELGSSNLMA